MTTTNDILLNAASLGAGERIRTVCPVCGGGRKGEETLSLARLDDGRVVWNCFRASCGERGVKGGGNLVRTRSNKPAAPVLTPYEKELQKLDVGQTEFLEKAIGWTSDHLEVARPLWAPEDHRYAFPILGPMGSRRGYVLRSYQGAYPKAMNYKEMNEPMMSWYRTDMGSKSFLLVEDIPSAVRASVYVNSVALCGTGITDDGLNELARFADRVLFALDDDATAKAFVMTRKHSLLFEKSGVLILKTDIKDMTERELSTMLAGRFNNDNKQTRATNGAVPEGGADGELVLPEA